MNRLLWNSKGNTAVPRSQVVALSVSPPDGNGEWGINIIGVSRRGVLYEVSFDSAPTENEAVEIVDRIGAPCELERGYKYAV